MKPRSSRHFGATSLRYNSGATASLAFAASLLLGAGSAFAQLTWDSANPNNNWSTTDTNWNTSTVAWTQNSDGIFNGTAETITPTVAVTFDDLSFDLTGFTIGAGAGSLVLGDDLGSTISVVSGGTATISETIANNGAGASVLTKSGTGTLVLNGAAANTWSGGTVISAGTLSSSQSAAIALLGTGPVSISSGATLNLTNTSASVDTAVANTLSGPGSITTTSATRAITMTGDMSGFTGTLNIGTTAGGKISVTPSVAMPSSAFVNIASGATLFTTAAKIFTNNFSLAGFGNTENRGALRIDSGVLISGNIALTADSSIGNSGASASTISGIISGGFGIRGATTGNQPVVLSGLNTFTGRTTLAGGNAFSVSTINNAGNAGNLGTNSTVDFGITTVGGTLVYTGSGETTDRVINLAGTTGGGAITQSGTGLLKFTSNLASTGAGTKTLTLNGSTAGTGEISGAIVDNSGTNKTNVTKDGTGTWTLSGNSTFTGNVTITAGPLVITNSGALGTGTKTITATNGTSGNCNLRLDGSAGSITLPSTFTYTVSNQTFDGTLVNVAGNNTVPGLFNITSGGGGFLISSLAGNLNISANITATASGRNVILSGPATGTVSGVISNGSTTTGLPVVKEGAGTWTLSGANTFTGAATANAGVLNVTGSLAGTALANGGTLNMVGTVAGASTANAGTLKLDYSSVNLGKLSDTAALNLGGGTVEIAGGTHSEKVGSTSLTAGRLSNVTRSGGATGFLKLGAVTANAGSQVVFSEDNLASTTTANINGILPWARVLVAGVPSLATNSGVSDGDGGSFITAFGGGITVDRLGGVIPNGITNNLKIVEAGVSGNITLAASPLTAASFLEMSATGGPAVIAPTAATDVLMIGDEVGGTIWQSSVAGALSIGTSANDGILTSGNTESGTATPLAFINDSTTNPLTVNSSVTNNGTTTPDVISINKGGAGSVILAGNNTFTGGVNAAAGSLVLSGSNVFAGVLSITNTGTSVTLSGNNQGRLAGTNGLTSVASGTILQLQANTGNTVSGTSFALSAEQTANQPLSLLSGSTLQLRSDNSVTFAGGNNLGGLGSATVTFDVNNLGSGSGNTLGLAPAGFAVNTTTLNVTGGNGYTLATGTINNVANGATLTLNPTTGNLSIAGYTANAGFSTTLVLGGSASNNLVTGVIANPATSGATTLTKSGSSVWTLQGANTFTGNTTISGGTLAISSTGSLGAAATYAGTIANSGTFSYGGSAAQTLSGVISGTGAITSSGNGSLRLSGINTYTGATQITGGTVIAQNSAALGTAAAGTTISGGGTLDLGGTLAATGLNLGTEVLTVSGTGVGGAGALVNNGTNDQINATGRIVLAGNTTFGGTKRWDLRSNTPTLDMGGFEITKTGVNTVSLVGVAVSNPGNVVINSGVFSVETTTTLGGSSTNTFTVNPTGTLQFYANTTNIPWSVNLNGATMSQINTSTTVTGNVNLANTGTNTISVTGTSLTLSGTVSGLGGFSKTGGTLLTLSGANDYSGATTISAGRLLASNDSALGATSAGTTVAAGSQLELGSGVTITSEPLSLSGSGTATGTGAFRGALQATAGAAAVWDGGLNLDLTDSRIGAQANGTLTVTGPIDDGANTFDLNVSADGTNGVVILSGVSTYGGNTEIIRGTLRLGGNDRLPTGTILDVDTAGGVTDAAILDLNGFNQTVGGLTDTATTNLTGLILNSAISTTSTLTVSNAADSQFDSVIADGDGLVALTKSGSAKLTLNGTNSYKGATSVQAGSLIVNGNQSAANGAVSVSSGATLGGNGILGGAVAITAGGTIAPGTTTTGALAVASADFAPGGVLAIDINDASTPKVDTLNATGALDITGATLALSITGTPTQSAYVIASYASGQLTGTFTNVTGLPLKYKVDYNYAGGTQIALVPSEYASWTVAKGLTAGVNDGPTDDPDGDGQSNKAEFAFDGNPLSGSASGKVVGKVGTVGGNSYMTLTVPVRNGATFADAGGPEVSVVVNGILYRITGSDTLVTWPLNVTEVTGPDATALQAGLPVLSDIDGDTFADWTYRTFRAPDPVADGNPADFLRASAE